jgi:hypothetical protein
LHKMTEKAELVNYTLRLPEDYRRRLELEAKARGRSLNQQLVRVIEMFFAQAGYASDLVVCAGETFRILPSLAYDTPAETAWDFALEDLRTGKEAAMYVLGIDRGFAQALKISDKAQAAKEVGLALLNFHARKERDIRCLSWTQPSSFTGKRILTEIEAGVETLPDFLEQLAQGQWEDRWLIPEEEEEAIKTLLITARLEKSPIVKHFEEAGRMWVQIGKQKFNGPERNVYVQALSKMGLLRLVELQAKTDQYINTYKLTGRAIEYLARIASWAR